MLLRCLSETGNGRPERVGVWIQNLYENRVNISKIRTEDTSNTVITSTKRATLRDKTSQFTVWSMVYRVLGKGHIQQKLRSQGKE